MEKRKKKYGAPRFPAFAISFWFDRSGIVNMKLTSNLEGKGLLAKQSMSMYSFGIYLAENELLDAKDKSALVSFCHAYFEGLKNAEYKKFKKD